MSTPKRVRVERGLYRAGATYYACATRPGARSASWRSLGTVGLMEARRLRDRFAAEVQTTPAAVTNVRMTFAELADAWLAEQRTRVQVGELAPRTLEIYEVGLRRHVLPVFGALQLRAIAPTQLVTWIRSLRAAGYAPDSVVGFWRPLHLVLGHAVRHGVIAANPADRLTASERPSPGPSRKRFLTRGEMRRLLEAAPAGYRTAIACGLFSGLRLSELLALTWRDVDLDERVLRVRHQLGRHGQHAPLKTPAARRDVILMSRLAHELDALRTSARFRADSDLVFCAASGRTIGHRNITGRGLAKAAQRAGLEGVTFHALRHTFASILIAQGRDPVFVSRQLGHTNAAITLRVYAHLFDAERHARAAREDLDAEYGELISATLLSSHT